MVDVRMVGVTVALEGTPVLVDVHATVPDGAFAAVIGPSGSGKSTLLRSIAGFAPVIEGRIELGDRDVTQSEPRDRRIGMVFQQPAMLPRRNVRRNVAFPLELRKETVESIRDRVDAETRAMRIEHLLLRDPALLSRGEQQLVQIARTMVRAPETLLLDEPFAPLDPHLRTDMRTEMAMLQRGYGVTTLMATNDPDDMSALADHLLVLGRSVDPGDPGDADVAGAFTVVQAGRPDELVAEPISLEVAAAVAPLWTVSARVDPGSPGVWLSIGDGSDGRVRAWSPALDDWVGRQVVVGFRRGDLAVHPSGDVRGVAERIVPGDAEPLLCRVGGRLVHCDIGAFDRTTIDARPRVRLEARRSLVFDPATGRRIA